MIVVQGLELMEVGMNATKNPIKILIENKNEKNIRKENIQHNNIYPLIVHYNQHFSR